MKLLRPRQFSVCLAATLAATTMTVIRANACRAPDPFLAVPGEIQRAFGEIKHPLVGRVLRDGKEWPKSEIMSLGNCGDQTELSEFVRYLAAKVDHGAIVMLGEVHDNAAHHEVRATILSHTSPFKGRVTTALVFEQLPANVQPALERLGLSAPGEQAPIELDDFKSAVDWQKSGWSTYKYEPLLNVALGNRLAIYAGDVTRDAIKKVAKEGEAAVPTGERAHLKLDAPLGAKLDDASLTDIEAAHCGMMPKEAFGGMAFAQRYRDASLADALLKAADKHGSAILIAGNEHVRTDRGVPWYIRQRAPDKKVVSVMLLEVEDGKIDPEAYVPRGPDGNPAADYIVFTPRAERSDPCEGMREKKGK